MSNVRDTGRPARSTQGGGIHVLIQARLGSTRLPRKVLMDIGGKSMLERVWERASQIGPPTALVIPEQDTELALYAVARDWPYLLGPEEDVLARYAQAATALNADHFIRCTADCPFLDVEAARLTLAEHLEGGYDLTTYHEAEGRGVQVYRTETLVRVNKIARHDMRHSPDLVLLSSYGPWAVHHVRFSCDTPNDLLTARRRAKEVEAWQK